MSKHLLTSLVYLCLAIDAAATVTNIVIAHHIGKRRAFISALSTFIGIALAIIRFKLG